MADSKIAISAPTLPKGGGAIRGIGQTFQPQEFTGTAALSIPVRTSPCRGFEPRLSVDYSSGMGNGVFGLGFALAIPNIARKTSQGIPKYDGSDTFVLSNADDLVPTGDRRDAATRAGVHYSVVSYRPRTEGAFARIERWIRTDGSESHWRVVSKDNVTSVFGQNHEGRISDPDVDDPADVTGTTNNGLREDGSHVFQWLLQETFDAKGNRILYKYRSENSAGVPDDANEKSRHHTANRYLDRIKYGNDRALTREETERSDRKTMPASVKWQFEVVFDYGEFDLDSNTPYEPPEKATWTRRTDSFSSYRSGFEIRTHRLCRRILMFHRFKGIHGGNPFLVGATHFEYESSTFTFLKSVRHVGYRDGAKKALPPLSFDYSRVSSQDSPRFEPLICEPGRDKPDSHGISGFLEDADHQMVDLHGDGLPGILYTDDDVVLYRKPLGQCRFAPWVALDEFPIERNLQDADYTLTDLGGDGNLDLVVTTPERSGYYESHHDGSWGSYRGFAAAPTELHSPQRQMVDVTGDGQADLLLFEPDAIKVYPSRGKLGYDRPHEQATPGGKHAAGAVGEEPVADRLPVTSSPSEQEVVLFADMFGDGGSHLVRIRKGSVECWPNLGHGRFGRKVELAVPPQFPDELDAKRLFLTDVDGSGATDLVYAYADHVDVYRNESGNRFSEPESIRLPRPYHDPSQIGFADVLGNGTTCLVFTSVNVDLSLAHEFYDFTGGVKPHLLTEIDNHMGATTSIHYCASTKFYLADKQTGGTPWITRLPFPVQVVEKTETIDHIGGSKLVSGYTYHHGYFDPHEREFRGFGRVERRDAEAFEESSQSGADGRAGGRAGDGSLHVPPVLTKTWYHTGVYTTAEAISRQFASEYYQEDDKAHTLPDTFTDPAFEGISPEKKIEACRALHGRVLREEVYCDHEHDPNETDHDHTKHPYAVTETSYHVRLMPAKTGQEHAVCLVHPSEMISYHYERNKADPRIEHRFIVKVDDYGNVLKSCQVFYPRRDVPGAHPEQKQLKALATIDHFINVESTPDATREFHLLGIPGEEKMFELGGLLPDDGDFLTAAHLAHHLEDALKLVIPIEQALTDKVPQARLLSWQRHAYWDQTLTEPLPTGEVAAHALHHHGEVAVFSDASAIVTYPPFVGIHERFTDSILREQAKYVRGDDGYWLKPGLVQHYEGQDSFYLPAKTIDPFGAETTVTHDDYKLIPNTVTDALGNKTRAIIDYRTLLPWCITDINDNKSEVRFDPLGMVIATSVHGTEDKRPKGDDPLASLIVCHGANAEGVVKSARHHLQQATSYFFYDLSAWDDGRQPPHAISLARETHVRDRVKQTAGQSEPTKIQIHIEFSDGFGRALQTKSLAGGNDGESAEQGEPTEEGLETQWLTSGRVVYNNKGKPVKQYEPFYSSTATYEPENELTEHGVTHVTRYDPLLRIVRVDTPKGFFSKVEFTPWQEKHYDENDTLKQSPFFLENNGKSELDATLREALAKAAAHADTPTTHVLDNQGRVFRIIQQLEGQEELANRHKLDIQGRKVSSTDPRNICCFEYAYDMTGAVLWTKSADAGQRWALRNAVGKSIHVWDGRGFQITTSYDRLQRPVKVHVQGGDGPVRGLNHVVERMYYGDDDLGHEDQDDKHTSADRVAAQEKNVCGRLVQHYDQAGLVSFDCYDIKGAVRKSRRQLRKKHDEEANWRKKKGDDEADAMPLTGTVERHGSELEAGSFTTETRYDALGRVTQEAHPDGSVSEPQYHPEGWLKQLDVSLAASPEEKLPFVQGISYNPKGQRTEIAYGNGVTTKYVYDDKTLRLTRLKTTRDEQPGCLSALVPRFLRRLLAGRDHSVATLQDLHYTHDPVGNITHVRDDAQQTLYFRNQKVEPDAVYTYDALYRLVEAKGREHAGQLEHSEFGRGGEIRGRQAHPHDGRAIDNYTENYEYDAAGNLLKLTHQTDRGKWTRGYDVDKANNRLSNNADDSTAKHDYDYDDHGNMSHMPYFSYLQWDSHDQLQMTRRQALDAADGEGAARGERTWYVYDAAGQRVRKVTEHAGGKIKHERIYLGHCEIYREYGEDGVTVNTLHVMDGEQRVALVETRTKESDKTPKQLVRYQFGNHLDSASLELNEQARIISYEEYTPFGGTCYQLVLTEVGAPKRYRYSAKERDDSTGFYYYGARYYAPWLGRWLSPDPAGTVDGLNLYVFARNNPIRFTDDTGLKASDWMRHLGRSIKSAGRFIKGKVTSCLSTSEEHVPPPEKKYDKRKIQRALRERRGILNPTLANRLHEQISCVGPKQEGSSGPSSSSEPLYTWPMGGSKQINTSQHEERISRRERRGQGDIGNRIENAREGIDYGWSLDQSSGLSFQPEAVVRNVIDQTRGVLEGEGQASENLRWSVAKILLKAHVEKIEEMQHVVTQDWISKTGTRPKRGTETNVTKARQFQALLVKEGLTRVVPKAAASLVGFLS